MTSVSALIFVISFLMSAFRVSSLAQRTVLWFRNDQRVLDNPIIHAAKGLGTEVICLYCFDPRHFSTTEYGSKKTDAYRAKFLVESVADLRSSLRNVGSDLFVSLGRPEDIIPSLMPESCKGKEDFVVLCQNEDAWEERKVSDGVASRLQREGKGVLKVLESSATLYHRDDLPYDKDLRNLPDGFTPFKQKVENKCSVRDTIAAPKHGDLGAAPSLTVGSGAPSGKGSYDFLPSEQDLGFDEGTFAGAAEGMKRGGVLDFEGGEAAGRARLQAWMFDGDNLKDYFTIRNGMLGEAYSSKFSPWLACGNLSPRYIRDECQRYERVRGISNKSTYWLVFELIWRDFFHFLCTKHGVRTFLEGGMCNVKRPWSTDAERVRRWKTGTTGVPLVDANMRELASTGWMSNRGRQNVASYLVLDMGVDWRIGADHFESLLLDHDVYSNYGNWNAAAGLTGGRVNRFNILKQSKDYDARGDYVRHWIPELAKVPAPLCFEPWKLSASDRVKYEVGDYPRPMTLPEPWSAAGGGGGGDTKKGAYTGNSGGRNKNRGSGGGNREGNGKRKGSKSQAASVSEGISWYVNKV